MANTLSNLLRSLRRTIGRGLQSLLKWINPDGPARPAFPVGEEAAGGVVQPQVNSVQTIIEQKMSFRIKPVANEFLAVCSSCGTVHPLDAVCHSCGRPLCRDPHCRLTRRHPQIKRDVVVCQACLTTMQSMFVES